MKTATTAIWSTFRDTYLNAVDPSTAFDEILAYAASQNVSIASDAPLDAVSVHLLWDGVKNNHPTIRTLRDAYEWDKDTAHDIYGLWQTSRILASLKIVVTQQNGSTAPVRAFIAVTSKDTGEKFRVIRDTMKDDPYFRATYIAQKESQLRNWCNGVVDIPEFDTLVTIIRAAVNH